MVTAVMGTAVLCKLQMQVSTRPQSSEKRNIQGLWQLCHWRNLNIYVHALAMILPLIFLGQGHVIGT